MTLGIFVLLESEIYEVSAPNQGALEGFTFGGDLLCVLPASNEAESSSNHVLFCSVLLCSVLLVTSDIIVISYMKHFLEG